LNFSGRKRQKFQLLLKKKDSLSCFFKKKKEKRVLIGKKGNSREEWVKNSEYQRARILGILKRDFLIRAGQ